MLGEDEEVKTLKRRMQALGCDMAVVKKWQKQLQLIRKQYSSVYGAYETAYESLKELERYVRELERLLCESSDMWEKKQIKQIQELIKAIRKKRTSFDHEFVVSQKDTEFHLICDTVKRLGERFDGTSNQKILLQSEVENLCALIAEKMRRKQPDGMALTYFYITHEEEELMELPPERRLEMIEDVFWEECLLPLSEEVKRVTDCAEIDWRALARRIVG